MNVKILITSILVTAVIASSCGVKNESKEEPAKTDENVTPSIDSSDNADLKFDAENTYDDSKLKDGLFESFYPDKSLKATGMIINGKRDGVWTAYHPNGNKQSENEYKNGILNGKSYTTFENGQVMYIGYYTDGKYDGQWYFYTKEGELSKEIIYKLGEQISVTEGKDFNKL